MTQHIVFYDASCPLCYHLKKNLNKLDKNNKLQWVAAQTAEKEPETYPYLQGKNIYTEIHMLTSQGVVMKGFYAIRRMLIDLPGARIPGAFLYFPFVDRAGSPLYLYVSKSRFKWFGKYDPPRIDE
ncbi:putative DCC family thiol-disulfide oxidoreductase YuxK [Sinobaca qinghaiensis]|uniref:Putative DCC family thiol-disulfide oxidoreductase YuxK n=1 Tax=Sinobaca qinghaiensis TaxID=342944 RepID=A0A419V744_9BACL|nr:DUF393 domain-containing protein [Sinobaca qinghaiensis]RKD75887.1 putative DCC family thiol-disulfide oxidoreductase YuxK [Sinobaca qinghaiensis]